MNLEGQIVLVTGASRGIGRAILHAFAARGATVIGTATSISGAEKITASLTEQGFSGQGMCLDVTNASQIEETLQAIAKQYGDISILVNNAGITDDNLLMRMKDEQWDRVIDTNLTSIYRLCKVVSKAMMKARFGRIINIASVVGVMGNAGQTNYAAAKAGLIGFSKALAREVGSRGITVNTIAPGFIATDMTDVLPEAQKKYLSEQVPLARLGTVEDIADAALYLADAAYVTGETLHVNGGMYMI